LEKAAFVGRKRRIKIFPNLFALTGIFLISNREPITSIHKKKEVKA
jgi:hypothetical protein